MLEMSEGSDALSNLGAGFSQRVEELVRQIPVGRVMTYGQIAALCGNARAARIVGGIAHFGDPDLPWQRVVNKSGGLAAGYPGGRAGHKAVLEAEGVGVSDEYTVDVQGLLWHPDVGNALEDPSGVEVPASLADTTSVSNEHSRRRTPQQQELL